MNSRLTRYFRTRLTPAECEDRLAGLPSPLRFRPAIRVQAPRRLYGVRRRTACYDLVVGGLPDSLRPSREPASLWQARVEVRPAGAGATIRARLTPRPWQALCFAAYVLIVVGGLTLRFAFDSSWVPLLVPFATLIPLTGAIQLLRRELRNDLLGNRIERLLEAQPSGNRDNDESHWHDEP